MKASITTRTMLLRSIITVAIVAILLAVYFVRSKPPPVAPLPNPNGYDDFVAAGKILQPLAIYWWSDSNVLDLKPELTTNRPALALARRGLARASQAPIDYSQTYEHAPKLANIKFVALAFRMDGKLAEAEGRLADAANDYTSIIALGIESGRGGFLIHSMVQISIEEIGVKRLRGIVSDIDAKTTLECLHILEKAEADRNSFDNFKTQEELLSLHAPLRERLAVLPLRIRGHDPTTIAEAATEKKYLASELAILSLEAALAAHAFELEKGRPATNWSDLVPGYLPNVPNDPTTNRPVAFGSW